MSKRPFLTIGMAVYNDFNGVYFSVQGHRLYQNVADCEFLVVDNNPDSAEGIATRQFVESIQHRENIRYIPYTEIGGTSQPRNKIVEEATGEFVMITDPHVFVQGNGIHRLKEYLGNADAAMRKNLFTGPLLYDGMNFVSTHFEPGFRDQMNGTWATAWQHPDGTLVVCREFDGHVQIRPLHVEGKGDWTSTLIPWVRHEEALRDRGYKVMGLNSDDMPFEIPGQGLGLFVTSKEHWIPFNRDFRGFGGEEIIHHAKYRQAGRTTYCLPFLKWVHRFGRPGGVPYPLTMENKIRNYLIGYRDLGWDIEEVRQHFVDEVKVQPSIFDMIAKDPVGYVPYIPPARTHAAPAAATSTSNLGLPMPTAYETVNDVVDFLAHQERDLNRHVGNFMQWTLGANTVVELTKRRESTAFFLGALGRKIPCNQEKCQKEGCNQKCNRPAELFTYQEEQDSLIGVLQELVKTHPGRPLQFTISATSHDKMVESIPTCDLLFLDTRHEGERLLAELERYSPSVEGRIMVHDTAVFGTKGENDTKGLFWAIKAFCRKHPEWFVAFHTDDQYGLTVLSKLPPDKPYEPVKLYQGTLDEDGKPCGCGQELKATLKLLGIEAAEGCSCNARAQMMDIWGPEKCRQEIETILDWLKEEADKRNMGNLYIRPVVKVAVLRAIRSAEKKLASGKCS